MKCPNCGAKIDDDKLYCEKCGSEIMLVSDIDMELEFKDTLTNIANSEFSDKSDKNDNFEFDDEDNPSILGLFFKGANKIGKIFYVFVFLFIVLIIFLAVKLGMRVSRENSLDYQVEMYEKKYSSNDLYSAISYLEKADKLDSDNSTYKFKTAEIYFELNNPDNAVYTLTEIGQNETFSEEDRYKAYSEIIDYYKENNLFSEIGTLLNNCTIPSVLNDYSAFIVSSPVFSVDEGTYTETKVLKLSGEGDGVIYYTLDGTDPLLNGTEYTNPIMLEYGSYSVKACMVNDYDISSEVITKNYLIDVAFSFSPTVEPESGAYDRSFMIEVNVPMMYTCYYTTDGSDPDKNSIRYTQPIPAAIGDNVYKFVVYASDGTMSEIVERNYIVNINTNIDPATAVTLLSTGLVERGYLDESGCHREGVDGTYLFMYSTVYPIEGMGDFYLVVEYIQDAFGNNKMTGNYYAIDCYNGVLYSVDITGEEGFILSPL